MKNILFSAIFAILSLVGIGAGISYDVKGESDAAKRCYAFSFASVAIVGVYHYNYRRSAEFCFLNKSFFGLDDRPFTRAEVELIQHITENGKSQTKEDFATGKIKLESYYRALRFEIADAKSGTFELLNAATRYVDGVIPEEFDKGQLPEGLNIAVSHIGIGFVADGSVTAAGNAVALASLVNSWPAVLRNGKLRVTQAGAVKQQIDCLYCGTIAASTGRLGEDDACELQAPFILEEKKQIKFELMGAGDAAFASPAGGNFIEIRLYGAFVRLRA